MIECYYSDCKEHAFKTGEEGPYCWLQECVAKPEEIKIFQAKRQKFLQTLWVKTQEEPKPLED